MLGVTPFSPYQRLYAAAVKSLPEIVLKCAGTSQQEMFILRTLHHVRIHNK